MIADENKSISIAGTSGHDVLPRSRLAKRSGADLAAADLENPCSDDVHTIIIEPRLLIRECVLNAMTGARKDKGVLAFPCVRDWLNAAEFSARPHVVFQLWAEGCPQRETAADITRLLEVHPTARIVLVSDQEELSYIVEALSYGVHGYIPMTMSLEVMLEVLQLVRAGGTFVPASAVLSARRLLNSPINPMPISCDLDMTARQSLVLNALRQGKPNKVIAHELVVAESTVKVHIRNIMKKLHAKNRTEVVFLTNLNRDYKATA